MPKREFADVEIVGGTYLSEKRTLLWKFRDFDRMGERRGEFVECGPLKCHGYSWQLRLYPRGSHDSSRSSVYLSAFLEFTGDFNASSGGEESIKESSERILDSNNIDSDTDSCEKYCEPLRIDWEVRLGHKEANYGVGELFEHRRHRGWTNLIKRDRVLDPESRILVDGALLVEIDIEVNLDRPKPFTPKSTLSSDMLQMLELGKWSDAVFVAGGKRFHLHRSVLALRAPVLVELAENADAGTEIELEYVNGSIFELFLRYVYAEEVPPPAAFTRSARSLLDMADRFGAAKLKLLAESKIVESGISCGMVADLLLFADSRSCALLKEAAVQYISANAKAVMSSPGWAKVKESSCLMAQIMEASLTSKLPQDLGRDNFDQVSVTTLLYKLEEEGLSCDGTREMLIERLKNHKNTKKRLTDQSTK